MLLHYYYIMTVKTYNKTTFILMGNKYLGPVDDRSNHQWKI